MVLYEKRSMAFLVRHQVQLKNPSCADANRSTASVLRIEESVSTAFKISFMRGKN
jgi:hypothetical protein